MAAKRGDMKAFAQTVVRKLKKLYPTAECALVHSTPLQLLISTILSAQCTDARVNMVTPILFKRFPTAKSLATADVSEIEEIVRSTGFFRNKAKNIKACCQMILDRFGGEVPRTMEELLELPGVARKTANVVLGNAFDTPGMVVDTHVGRITRRLGLTKQTDPVKVEQDLMKLLPPKEWTMFSHRVIYLGRQICQARKPNCPVCVFDEECPKVGVVRK
jgi:endonuclease-3